MSPYRAFAIALPFSILFAACSSEPTSIPPESSQPVGRIAFLGSDSAGNPGINSVNTDGSDLKHVIEGITGNQHPILLAGPSWSPDWKQFVYSAEIEGHAEIFIANADGSGVIRLTNNSALDTAAAWSPDGSKIAFVSDRDLNMEIFVINVDGTDLVNITNNPTHDSWLFGFLNYPAWSPDSKQIAFTSDRDGNFEIYVMQADGSKVQRLTDSPENDAFMEWSPDGSKIVFETNRDGNFEVYVMNPDGSDQVNLTSNSANDFFGSWSPDSSSVLVETGCSPSFICDIAMVTIDDFELTLLAPHSANDIWPVWSPDGNFIALTSERDGNPEIYVINVDGSGLKRLTNNSAEDGRPVWVPAD